MCMDEATRQSFAHLEELLKQHEHASACRGNEVVSMIAMLPDPVVWTGALRIPFLGLVTLTLRPMSPAAAPLRGGA